MRRDGVDIGGAEEKWGSAMKSVSPDGCPSASALIDFVERGPKSKEFGSIAAHLGRCPACRAAVLEMRSVETTLAAQPKPGIKWGRLWSPAALAAAAAVLAVATVPIVSHRLSSLSHGPKPISKPANERVAMVRPRTSPAKRIPTEVTPHPLHRVSSPNEPTHLTNSPGTGTPVSPPTLPPEKDPDMSQLYCLVGPSHVYTLDPTDANLAKRRQIEEDYADQVSVARREYVRRLSSGSAKDAKARELNFRLKRAADLRDQRLGHLYRRDDDLLKTNPGLKREGNGPYQIVRIGYRTRTGTGRPADFSFLPPWPGYRPAGRTFAPTYHVRYSPETLRQSELHAHHEYLAAGKPAFTGLVGHTGPVEASGLYESKSRDYLVKLPSEPRPNGETSGSDGYTRREESGPAPVRRTPLETKPVFSKPDLGGSGEADSKGDANGPVTDSHGYVHTTGRGPSSRADRPASPSDYTRSRFEGAKTNGSANSDYRRGPGQRDARDPSTGTHGGYRSEGRQRNASPGGFRSFSSPRASKNPRRRDQDGHR